MFYFYRSITSIFSFVFKIIIYIRKLLGKEDKSRFREKINSNYYNIKKIEEKKLAWFHCASIGEMKSIAPIAHYLAKERGMQVLVTTLTLSSSKLFPTVFNKDLIFHRFLPLDTISLVKDFLKGWKPSIVMFVDSEIWPNFLFEIKKEKIPLLLLNARLTDKSFKRWNIIRSSAISVFNCFDRFVAASEDSKNNLKKLNLKNVDYFGNLKFSVKENFNDKNENSIKNKFIWCAASTHDGEEEICIDTHIKLKKKINKVVSIIIPRHIERAKKIEKLAKNYGLDVAMLNKGKIIEESKEIVVVNTFGYLQKYFSICNDVFIGKSLLKKFSGKGGQNPIEAAKSGCKVYHGPFVYNFDEVYSELAKLNISFKVSNSNELVEKLFQSYSNNNNLKLKNLENLNIYGEKILNENINIIEKYL